MWKASIFRFCLVQWPKKSDLFKWPPIQKQNRHGTEGEQGSPKQGRHRVSKNIDSLRRGHDQSKSIDGGVLHRRSADYAGFSLVSLFAGMVSRIQVRLSRRQIDTEGVHANLQQVFPNRKCERVLWSRVPDVWHRQERFHRLQGILARDRRDIERQAGGEAQLGLQVRKMIRIRSGKFRNQFCDLIPDRLISRKISRFLLAIL